MQHRQLVLGVASAAALAVCAWVGAPRAQEPAPTPPVQAAPASPEPAPPGKAVYQQYCAACHDQPAPGSRAPALANLQQMSEETIRTALTEGVMQPQAAAVPRQMLRPLIAYLAVPETPDNGEWVKALLCAEDRRAVDLEQPVALSMVGTDPRSSRQLSAKQAGLASADLGQLELAWAIGFPKTTGLRSSPVIVGSTLFYAPVQTGRLLALDIAGKPCAKWVYEAGTQLRSSVSYGELGKGGPKALVFADRRGQVHAVDARTGALIWKAEGRHTQQGQITGAPVLYGDKIIVPVSASGVGRGATPAYECCDEHGAVVALDAKTGKQLWVYHTMEDAKYTGQTSRTGVKLRGPSGAPIWSTPSIDAARGLVYATSGQNTSLPATGTSDSVIAIDLATGVQKWVFQALPKDVWNLACQIPWERSGPNCPKPEESALKDFDFGGAAVLVQRKSGKDILLAGQKSGDVWALDPDAGGKLVWRNSFGKGTSLGGVHWGLATDGERVFAPINDPFATSPELGFTPEPGMNAIDIETGKVLWRKPVTADCSPARQKRFTLCNEKFGLSATPLVVDHSVIAGAIDGRLYIYDAKTGDVVFQYDTLREFETINGVPARGGSIDSHSVFAGAGMVFVASGYGSFRQPSGNVLLAFRPKK